MKYYIFSFILCLSITSYPQWVQSSLNAGSGRGLYSDGTRIFAATSSGVYNTTDNGEPWINIGLQNQDVFDVITSGGNIIAGTMTGIYISADNGQNWHNAPSMDLQNIRALVKNDNYVFAAAWGGGIFRSPDNGENWESAGLTGMGISCMISEGNKIFAGVPDLYSKIYATTDNGNTWTSGSLNYPASNLKGLFYSSGKLFALDFGLWASTDMGQSWYLQYGITLDSTGYPIDIKLFHAMTKVNGYLVASIDFNSIHFSPDNGATWFPFNEGLIADWSFADVTINGAYIWSLRDSFGNAYRRPVSDLITGVEDITPPEGGYFISQNYPNPFNPATVIRFSVPEEGFVNLTVYNSLGQKITSLVNETRQAGSYQVEFNAGNLPSGVYFYRLETGSFLVIKKMLLLK